jgi:hypothetical protein
MPLFGGRQACHSALLMALSRVEGLISPFIDLHRA